MTSPETIKKVRLDKQKGLSQRKIAKKRGINKKTVKLILETDLTEFDYSTRKKQNYPKLDLFKTKLEEMLKEEMLLPHLKRSKFTRIYERLIELGYRGGYDSIRRYGRRWLKENHGVVSQIGCIPLEFDPGEAFQFDWTPETAIIGGVERSVHIATVTLCYSRMSFIRVYYKETTEMVLDAHVRAFNFFKGSCKRGVYDNMKTAVIKILKGKERHWQKNFELMSSHYLFEHNACTPRQPQEKGRVERRIQTVQEDFFRPAPKADNLNLLNEKLEDDCIKRSRMRMHPEIKDKTVWEVFLEEQKSLMYVTKDFDAYIDKQCSISKTQLVQFDTNKYSVPVYNKELVDLRVYADKLVFIQGKEVIAEHKRVFDRDKTITKFEHYLNALERKPGSLRNGIPFQEDNIPTQIIDLYRRMKDMYEDADKQFVEILCLVREHGVNAISSACELALESDVHSKDAVINILYRTNTGAKEEPMEEPKHLKLNNPPSDDCSEYNHLITGVTHEQAGTSI